MGRVRTCGASLSHAGLLLGAHPLHDSVRLASSQSLELQPEAVCSRPSHDRRELHVAARGRDGQLQPCAERGFELCFDEHTTDTHVPASPRSLVLCTFEGDEHRHVDRRSPELSFFRQGGLLQRIGLDLGSADG